jgi:hypothetical protein
MVTNIFYLLHAASKVHEIVVAYVFAKKFVKVNIAQCEFFEVNLKRMKKTQS